MNWYCVNGQWQDGSGRPIKTVPMQLTPECRQVPHAVAAEGWKEYDAQGHGDQSLERLCERGGFSATELAILLYERIKRIETTRPEVAELIEALRPLAMLGGPDDGCAAAFHDIEDDTLVYENSGKCITAGDVRAARKLVSRYAQPIATAERMRSPQLGKNP